MDERKKNKRPDITLLVLSALVLSALAVALWNGGWQLAFLGVKEAGRTVEYLSLRMALGLVLAGFIQTLMPTTLVVRWLGPASGLKGLLLGSYIPLVFPGLAPYLFFPLAASLYRAGAAIGPIIAMITAQSTVGFQGLIVWWIPFMGPEIALVSFIAYLPVPPLVGLAGSGVFRLLGLPSKKVTSCDADSTNLPLTDRRTEV